VPAETASGKRTDVSPHTAESIQHRMVGLIARKLGIATHAIDCHKAFADYGLDSVIAVALIQEVEDWFQRPLEVTLVWRFPTIALLAHHLASEISTSMSSPQVPMEPQMQSTGGIVSMSRRDAPPSQDDPSTSSARLDTLSEADIAGLLQQEIATARQRKSP